MTRPILTTLALLASIPAFGQAAAREKAVSLDELLQRVEQARRQETAEQRERAERFTAARSEQQRLLREAQQEKQAAERRSEELERTFERNEARIDELAATLEGRLGSLKEMFGVLQQVTGNTQGLFRSSVISAQYPDREEFLAELAEKAGSSSRLATIEDMEQLWFELQREMTESAKVARFTTQVITTDGEKLETEVARVGSFNIVSDGKYLEFSEETGNVLELPRQPQGRFVGTTSDLLAAQSGTVQFGLDPSRGSILSLLVQSPSFAERVDQGGLIGYLTLVLGALALAIAVERLVVLGGASRKVESQLKSRKPRDDNPLGRVLLVAEKHKNADLESLELKMGEAILTEAPKLSRGLLFLKIISVVAPLMGLLGTVTGMINTFQVITLFGTGDPKIMAGGISQALVTTVIGLSVAIPTVLLHTLVSSRSRRIIHVLEEQSAGIVAEHAEKAAAAGAS
jgi:biopolymer transport protein ExbB